ncbi:MAG: hypothetical protein SFW65_05395 [Alphaproteobacteria bacterium]|nr:hypothetical protein [Alphaproteobacteria bacterium]
MEQLKPILDALYAPQAWFLAQSHYVSMTIVGLIIAATLTLSGFVLARLGYKPLWALLLIVPTASVISLWVLALVKFPREK